MMNKIDTFRYYILSKSTVCCKNLSNNKLYYFNARLNLEKYMREKGFENFEWELLSTQKLENYKNLWVIKIYSSDDKADYIFLLNVIERSKCINFSEKDFKVDYFEVIQFDITSKEYRPNNLNAFLN